MNIKTAIHQSEEKSKKIKHFMVIINICGTDSHPNIIIRDTDSIVSGTTNALARSGPGDGLPGWFVHGSTRTRP